MNVNINLPQSEFAILKKMAKALGDIISAGITVSLIDINHINMLQRNELVKKLHGSVQLPENFDYKKEMEQVLSKKYGL